jgi:hypothetical protein
VLGRKTRRQQSWRTQALAIFGYIKGHFTGAPPLRSAIQTVLIGGLAGGRGVLDRASHFVMAQTLMEPLREWTIEIRETAGQGP